jgi:hypothetical protein
VGTLTIPFGVGGVVPGAKSTAQPGRKITAQIASIDTGLKVNFDLPPAEHSREFGAQWDEAGVAESDPMPHEYRHTQPERRSYHIWLDGYARPGGEANTVEPEIRILRLLTKRVPGKVRAHKCIYTQGEQSFRCFVESVEVNVHRIGRSGGALQAEITLNLKELAI